MNAEQKQKVLERLQSIHPGKNYPTTVTVNETVEGKKLTVNFALVSYIVGMYASITITGDAQASSQTGDHNNATFVRRLKGDIRRAIERGAEVTIGSIEPIKTE